MAIASNSPGPRAPPSTGEVERMSETTHSQPAEVREGGLAKWAPRITPPIGVDLTLRQELACPFRIRARTGFSGNIAGHIPWSPDSGGDMWVNPWGLWWEGIKASATWRVQAGCNGLEG